MTWALEKAGDVNASSFLPSTDGHNFPFFQGLTTVTTLNLTVGGQIVGILPLPSLATVSGGLYLHMNPAFCSQSNVTLMLPMLGSIGGGFCAEGCAGLGFFPGNLGRVNISGVCYVAPSLNLQGVCPCPGGCSNT